MEVKGGEVREGVEELEGGEVVITEVQVLEGGEGRRGGELHESVPCQGEVAKVREGVHQLPGQAGELVVVQKQCSEVWGQGARAKLPQPVLP